MNKKKKTQPLLSAFARQHFEQINHALLSEKEAMDEFPQELDSLFQKSVQKAWVRHRVKRFFDLFFSLLLIATFIFLCWFLPYRWSRKNAAYTEEKPLPINYWETRTNVRYVDEKGFIYFGISRDANCLPAPKNEEYAPLKVSDCDGYYLTEQGCISLFWFLEDQKMVMELTSDNLSKEELIIFAEKLTEQARE